MKTPRWVIEKSEIVRRKSLYIYEGVVTDREGGERVRFHFTAREDLLIGDFQSETIGVHEFLRYLSSQLGEPEREPYAIFLGEFGDGEAAIPVTIWWRKDFDESIRWLEEFAEKHTPGG